MTNILISMNEPRMNRNAPSKAEQVHGILRLLAFIYNTFSNLLSFHRHLLDMSGTQKCATIIEDFIYFHLFHLFSFILFIGEIVRMNIKKGALKYFSLEKVFTIYNKNVKYMFLLCKSHQELNVPVRYCGLPDFFRGFV